MVLYPITVPVRPYRGADKRKQRKYYDQLEIARILERHVNGAFEEAEKNGWNQIMLDYSSISRATGIPLVTVRKLMHAVDCGSNGIIVCNSRYDFNATNN